MKKIPEKSTLRVVQINDFLAQKQYLYDADYTVYKACFPSWDNSPRKAYSNGFCFQLPDGAFAQWLSDIIAWTRAHHDADKQYVYINAWNEWAEGAMLEPDVYYGYRNLDIVKRCLEIS